MYARRGTRRVSAVALRPEHPDLLDVVLRAGSTDPRRAADVDVGVLGASTDRFPERSEVVRRMELGGEYVLGDAMPELQVGGLGGGAGECPQVDLELLV